jgi:hypothetical protein
LIRRGALSRLERIVASVIGVGLLAVSAPGLAFAIVRGPFRLLLAAAGGVAVACMFIAAALIGRPLGRSQTGRRRSRSDEQRGRTSI